MAKKFVYFSRNLKLVMQNVLMLFRRVTLAEKQIICNGYVESMSGKQVETP